MPRPAPALLTGLAWFSFQTGVQSCLAQIPPTNARAVGLGGATSVMAGLDAVADNPAALAEATAATVRFGFSRWFGLDELAGRGVETGLPLKNVVLNLGLAGFGYEASSMTEIAAGLGLMLGDLEAGVRFRLLTSRFERYGGASEPAIDVGWRYPIASGVTVGAAVRNIGAGSIQTGGLAIGTGLEVAVKREALLLASLDMMRGAPLDLRFGLEVRPANPIALRLGGSGNPGFATAGAGLAISRLLIDFAFAYHPRLGGSRVLTVGIEK